MIELAELILSLSGSKSKIVYRPLPSDDPRQRRPDISLAKKVLNWEPRVDVRVGLTRTIEYFDQLLASHAEGAVIDRSRAPRLDQANASL